MHNNQFVYFNTINNNLQFLHCCFEPREYVHCHRSLRQNALIKIIFLNLNFLLDDVARYIMNVKKKNWPVKQSIKCWWWWYFFVCICHNDVYNLPKLQARKSTFYPVHGYTVPTRKAIITAKNTAPCEKKHTHDDYCCIGMCFCICWYYTITDFPN